jgi:ATP-binding cassette, subfamily B, heavy metal transporter
LQVIAHRLSTVVNADNIVVLRAGEAVEQGRHSELMRPSARGFYRSLMATQQTAYLAD